jgi:L-ascorbate metabolism protein UlaG (beta-lactamase superfamily)
MSVTRLVFLAITAFKVCAEMADSQKIVRYLDPVDLVNIESLPKADIILVTHDHQDHFSSETITALSKEGTRIVSIRN